MSRDEAAATSLRNARSALQCGQAVTALPNEPRAAFRYGTASFIAGDYAAAAAGFEAATDP